MKRLLTVMLLFVLWVGAPACDDDGTDGDVTDGETTPDVPDMCCDEMPEPDAPPDLEADPQADPEPDILPTPESFAIVVEGLDIVGEAAPMAALVACDMPDGRRFEDRTDNAGRLHFQVDWSAGGTMAFTLQLQDEVYPLLSYTGLTEAHIEAGIAGDGDFHLTFFTPWFTEVDRRGFVEVGGQAQNVPNDAQNVFVSASPRYSTSSDEEGADWSLEVPPDTPFQLVALAWTEESERNTYTHYGWASAQSDGVTEPTTIEIDFADALVANRVSGGINYPRERATPFFAAATYWSSHRAVDPANPSLSLHVGFPMQFDYVSGGVEYDYEWVELEGLELLWSHSLNTGFQGTYSDLWVLGPPADSVIDLPFLEPPVATAAEDGSVEWTLNSTDDADESLRQLLSVSSGFPPYPLLQTVFVPIGVRSTTIPAPPYTVDAEAYYGDTLYGRVFLCEWDDTLPVLCAREAGGQEVELDPTLLGDRSGDGGR